MITSWVDGGFDLCHYRFRHSHGGTGIEIGGRSLIIDTPYRTRFPAASRVPTLNHGTDHMPYSTATPTRMTMTTITTRTGVEHP
jgi:hypothetical protein